MASYNFQYIDQKVYFFTGKIRAFWKDKVFFLDQRNAAVVNFGDLYIHGTRASQSDLHSLDAQVANSQWELAPILHSYVVRYNSRDFPPWPYKLKGKQMWEARFAWIGDIPLPLQEQLTKMNVVYMPITYYTGKAMNLFEDKMLYGDNRNVVLVNLSEFCIHGQMASNRNALQRFNYDMPNIHSFIISLEFLMNRNYDGPELQLPTWPAESYGACAWVAKFAWQGEMAEEFKRQLGHFHIIKISDWNSVIMGNIPRPIFPKGGQHQYSSFSASEKPKKRENELKCNVPLLASSHKEAAIVKGSLLVANQKYGLINSCLDIIVFSTKNFYVNGEVFKENCNLDEYFGDKKVPLTVWMEPLAEPVLVFDIYVLWRAVCVWHRTPPKNMENIKKQYDKGNIAGSVPQALNTRSDNRYTLVLGEIVNVTHSVGNAIAKVGNMSIDIIFRKKAVYIEGCKYYGKPSLMEIKPQLETGVWTFLVYPTPAGNEDSKVPYTALAVWQYSYQHLVSSDLLHRILVEGGAAAPDCEPQGSESGSQSDKDKLGKHITGMIVLITADYGILETRSVTIEPSYVFFLRKDLYIDGSDIPSVDINNDAIDKTRQVNLFARYTKRHEINGYFLKMYATQVWMGKKPQILKESSQASAESPAGNVTPSGPQSEVVASGSAEEEDSSAPTGELESSKDGVNGDSKTEAATLENRPSSPVLEYRLGHFVHIGNTYGIVSCGKNKVSYVLFDMSAVWVHKEQLGPQESLHNSLVTDKAFCEMLVYATPETTVNEYCVSFTATAVWLGRRPSHINLPVMESPLKAMNYLHETIKTKLQANPLPKKILAYRIKLDKSRDGCSVPDITSKAANLSLEESDANSKLSDNYTPDLRGMVVTRDKPYVGKRINGRILKLSPTKGIALWRSSAKEAEVYILFNRQNVFVDRFPMKEDFQIFPSKSCVFYVLPMKFKTIDNYRVSLYATCGWIGKKPTYIPPPGSQLHSDIPLDLVFAVEVKTGKKVTGEIVKVMAEKGIARWRSVHHRGDIYLEFGKESTCEAMQLQFEGDSLLGKKANFYVKPMDLKELEGYVVSLEAICSWTGKKPSDFPEIRFQPTFLAERLHITPIDSDLLESASVTSTQDRATSSSPTKINKESVKDLDDVGALSSAKEEVEVVEKKKKKGKADTWEEDTAEVESLQGKIVEFHSNVGRLEGTDGVQHFFARENSYLYGVCLSTVELWHVLVQGETVNYRLTELTAGQIKVSKMWIGPEKVERDLAASHIYEWCSKHLVPAAARDLLIHQLEAS